MKFIDAIKLAMQNILRTKFRSFLTILGVVIGISAIVSFVSLGIGLQKITSDQIAGMNTLTTITVTQTPATSTMEEGPKLNQDTVDRFKNIKHVLEISSSVNVPANTVSEGTNAGAIVYGIEKDNQNLELSNLFAGKNIEDEKSAIISSALASAFSPNKESVIGKKLTIKIIEDAGDGLNYGSKEIDFNIVGIDSNETTNMVYVPINAIYSVGKFDSYSAIKIKVDSSKNIDQVNSAVKAMGYQVTTIKDLIDQIDKVFLLIEVILGLIGGIGLLVSSLGIINTMTMSLLERTHEIGIMKAIGATNRDIRRLFMFESALIGFLGGITGVGLSVAIGNAINLVVNSLIRESGQRLDLFITPLEFSVVMVMIAIIIAMFAGIFPTRRAQKLNPIDALRQ